MRDTKSVKVLNWGRSPVALKGLNREYLIEAASDDRAAFVLMSLEDVDYINSHTPVFRNGIVTFEECDYAEVHERIGNLDVVNTSFDTARIRDMILHPTYEKMAIILGITSIAVMERFRGELRRILAKGVEPVSGNVTRLINERFREVNNGLSTSRITLQREGFVAAESASNAALQAQLAALAAKVADLEAEKSEKAEDVEPEHAVEDVKPEPAPVSKTSAPKKKPIKAAPSKSK